MKEWLAVACVGAALTAFPVFAREQENFNGVVYNHSMLVGGAIAEAEGTLYPERPQVRMAPYRVPQGPKPTMEGDWAYPSLFVGYTPGQPGEPARYGGLGGWVAGYGREVEYIDREKFATQIEQYKRAMAAQKNPRPMRPSGGAGWDDAFMTGRQKLAILTMARAMVLIGDATVKLGDALGKDTNDLVAAVNLLRADHSEKNIKSLTKLLKEHEYTSTDFEVVARGTEEQKAVLREAMKEASRKREASHILLGALAVEAVGALSEVADAFHENWVVGLFKGIGFARTWNHCKKMHSQMKKSYALYYEQSNTARQLLNPEEVKEDSREVKELAKSVADGGLGF